MTFVSYAQNFEDVMLWRAFKSVPEGNYIDVGAQDPLSDSVSKAFHDAGWRGIHVEPSTHYVELLRAARPGDIVIQAAVSDVAGVLPFFEIAGTGISTIDPDIAASHAQRGFKVEEISVVSITLESVFAANKGKTIHWLKLDIEGAEKLALQSWGSSANRPLVVVVECTVPFSQVETSQQWQHLLLDRGYQLAYFDGLNRFYVVDERPDLKALLSVPPSVFDDFAVSGTASSPFHSVVEARLRAEVEAAALQLTTAEHELGALQAAMERAQASADLRLTQQQEALNSAEREAATAVHALESARSEVSHLRQVQGEWVARAEQAALQASTALQALAEARSENAQRIAESGQALVRAMQDASDERSRTAVQHRDMLQELRAAIDFRANDAIRRADEAVAAATARLLAAEEHARVLEARVESERQASRIEAERALLESRQLEGELSRSTIRQIETEAALRAANASLQQCEQEVLRSRSSHDRLTEALVSATQETMRIRAEFDELRQHATANAAALRTETDARQAAQAQLVAAEARLSELQLHGNAVANELKQQVDAAQLRCAEAESAIRSLQARAEETASAHAMALADAQVAFAAHLQAVEAKQAQTIAAMERAANESDRARLDEVTRLQQDLAQRSAEFDMVSAELAATAESLQSLRESAIGRLLGLIGQFPQPIRAVGSQAAIGSPAPIAEPTEPSFPANGPLRPATPLETHVLDKLLVLDDMEFVYAAYRTVLKRDPDPEGERNYVGLMRAGIDKTVVLAALADSEEGRKAGVVIPGLAAAVRRRRLARVPLIGPLAVGLVGLMRPAPALDPARAFVSQSIGLHNAVRATLDQVQSSVEDIRQRQERMESTVRRLGERQDELGANIANLQARILHVVGQGPAVIGRPEAAAPNTAEGNGSSHDLRFDLLRKASAWRT